MPEILSFENQLARPLFHKLERTHALVAAFFEGFATARLFVDDIAAPKSGVIVCNSRVLCAGDTPRIDFVDEMARTFTDELHRQGFCPTRVLILPLLSPYQQPQFRVYDRVDRCIRLLCFGDRPGLQPGSFLPAFFLHQRCEM